MKTYTKQLKDLEKSLEEDINKTVLSLVSIKFGKKISEIAKVQISPIIRDAINETIWINEIKDNILEWVKSYIETMEHEKHTLSNRMCFLEQRFLDFYRKVEQEFVRK